MPDKITSMVHLFADDTKISLRLTNQNQTNDLQNDIDRLDEWSDKWKLRFNVAKCKTMHIGYHNDKHIYQMGSGESRMDLNQVTSENDLGITFQDLLLLLLVTSGSSAASSWQLGHHKVSSI